MTLEDLGDWLFVLCMMFVLNVFGIILNDGVTELKELSMPAPAHCVWQNFWEEACG